MRYTATKHLKSSDIRKWELHFCPVKKGFFRVRKWKLAVPIFEHSKMVSYWFQFSKFCRISADLRIRKWKLPNSHFLEFILRSFVQNPLQSCDEYKSNSFNSNSVQISNEFNFGFYISVKTISEILRNGFPSNICESTRKIEENESHCA